MGCEHTMLTYTRCMDSALCVPLMIDSAVFCDYFAKRGVGISKVAAALAYLFKVNEGAAQGSDPGFFNQSGTLSALLDALPADPTAQPNAKVTTEPDATLDTDVLATAAVEFEGGVLCAGLSCVDMQLMHASEPTSREAIARFSGCSVSAGGSASNTASALRALGIGAAVLTQAGADLHGDELARQYAEAGIDVTLLLRDSSVSTSLAVLPVFEQGGRGCWVDLSANNRLTAPSMLEALRREPRLCRDTRALHVGYPHLLPNLQGDALRSLLIEGSAAIAKASGGRGAPLLSLDVNGATLGPSSDADGVVAAALPHVDLLHANLEEASHLVGATLVGEQAISLEQLRAIVAPLLGSGVAIAAITLGASGVFVAVTQDEERLLRGSTLGRAAAAWRGAEVRLPALPVDGGVNANGAGDAFCAGMLAAMLWRAGPALTLEQAALLALGSARQRVDGARCHRPESATMMLQAWMDM